jgi:membrane-associated phospholipid phosphatase
MLWWSHFSALGGLNVSVAGALAIAGWLAAVRCWRAALAWCLAFCATMLVAAGSQMAFIGWGIGVRSLDFAGFSGHAARAAVLYPAALFLLLERVDRPLRRSGFVLGVLVAAIVAYARVAIGAHSVAEALSGWVLGSCAALLFAARAETACGPIRVPLLAGLALPLFLLPYAEPAGAGQWITGLSLALSGHDRPYLRGSWQPAGFPYVPPCAPEKLHLGYLCLAGEQATDGMIRLSTKPGKP